MGYSLGVDVGSVSTNLVLVDEEGKLARKLYLRTNGRPIDAVRRGLREISGGLEDSDVVASGTTGSGRRLAGVLIGADIIKNEITAHAAASVSVLPDVRTIIEIGGQDSKIILVREGYVFDFAMNAVCAAGTGSFLDRQASRLGIPIEEFGSLAELSKNPVRIAGRCAVFAESDMISKQQSGHKSEDIIAGLCEALVRNYLGNLAKGREIEAPVMFQGGVAANRGILNAFAKALGTDIFVPEHYDVMGALGAALIALEEMRYAGRRTRFSGFSAAEKKYGVKSFECAGCANICEVVRIDIDGVPAAFWGDRCGKWSALQKTAEPNPPLRQDAGQKV